MRNPATLACALAVLALLPACGGDTDGPTTAGEGRAVPVVYTTFYPTTYFAERLAGDDARVVCPLPADEDPIFWQPPEDVVLAYQDADLIVLNGAEFEKWVTRASLPESRIVSTAAPFREDWITFANAIVHSHGRGGAHTHKGTDGHTWLDPNLAKVQAAQIAKALQRELPGKAAAIDGRLARLDVDLDALDARLRELTEPYDGHAILASHPAYNYLAKRYGWHVVNLALDPETMPSDDDFAKVRALLDTTPARHILWESPPREAIATRMRDELGLESVWFSPCETPPDGEVDYLDRMNANLDAVARVLAPTPGD